MKKSDLKAGMIVKLRNDRSYIVLQTLQNDLFFSNSTGAILTYEYNDDLLRKARSFCENDVMEVYGNIGMRYALCDLLCPSVGTFKLLWKRKETKEMTVAEISEALGYEVKVVK